MATPRKAAPKKTGRPSKYHDDVPRQSRALYAKGMTDLQVADVLAITRQTIDQWSKTHPAFAAARIEGKEVADDQIELALYKNAAGGNLGAQIFWLRNRRPERWRLQPAPDDVDEVVPPRKVVIEIQSGPAAQPHSPAG